MSFGSNSNAFSSGITTSVMTSWPSPSWTHCQSVAAAPVLRTVWTWFLHRSGLPVYGTAETREMNRVVCGGDEPAAFDWHTIDERAEFSIGAQRWRFSATDHPVETLAARVEVAEKSFVFSSDTGPAWTVDRLGPDDRHVVGEFLVEQRDPFEHARASAGGIEGRHRGVGRPGWVWVNLCGVTERRGCAVACPDKFRGTLSAAAASAAIATAIYAVPTTIRITALAIRGVGLPEYTFTWAIRTAEDLAAQIRAGHIRPARP